MSDEQLFDMPAQPVERPANPCIALYGPGPAATTCKECVHLRYRVQRNPKRWWKCDLRRVSHSPSTDHRVSWPACGRYEQRTQEYHGG